MVRLMIQYFASAVQCSEKQWLLMVALTERVSE